MIRSPFYTIDKEWLPDENHWEPLDEPIVKVLTDPDLIIWNLKFPEHDDDFELPF